jgi:hypothetical protein
MIPSDFDRTAFISPRVLGTALAAVLIILGLSSMVTPAPAHTATLATTQG